MAYQTPIDRPDLQNKSVIFATIKGAGIGTILGTGIHVVVKIANSLNKEVAESHLMPLVALVAGFNGAVALVDTIATNRQKYDDRPYVERLERELAMKNGVAR